jgi:histidinol-phosphate aminotransferase
MSSRYTSGGFWEHAMLEMSRREWLALPAAAAADGFAFSPIAAKSGVIPIRLSLNENPFGPSPLALQAIRDHLGDLYRYSHEEIGELTAAIVTREGIAPEQIVIGEILDGLGLYLAARGGPGGEFIYSEPGYTALVDAVAPGGGVVVGIPLNEKLENDLDAIAKRVGPRTRAIYLVNPHNPSGTVSDPVRFIEFVRNLSKRALVIVDEAYLEFTAEFEERTAAILTRQGENVVVFRTFSKFYGLAGIATGYALAPVALAASLRKIGFGAFYGLNRFALVAAAASLGDKKYATVVPVKIAAERDLWHRLFRKLKLDYAESRANFVFFNAGRPHDVVARALAKRGIDIGRAFPPLDSWVRVSIGRSEENAAARAAIAELYS